MTSLLSCKVDYISFSFMKNINVIEWKIGGLIMLERITKVLVDAIQVDEEDVKLESNLYEDLKIDSLSAVELALELETEFDISIEDEELAKLETVQDIINLIEAKI